MGNEYKEITLGNNGFPIVIFNTPQRNLSDKIIYLAIVADASEQTANQLAKSVCDIAKQFQFNNKINTDETTYNQGLIISITQEHDELASPEVKHVFNRMLATGFQGGLSIEDAYAFAKKVVETFEEYCVTSERLKLTRPELDDKTLSFKTGQLGDTIKLTEVFPGGEKGIGEFKLEYLPNTEYGQSLESAINNSFFC